MWDLDVFIPDYCPSFLPFMKGKMKGSLLRKKEMKTNNTFSSVLRIMSCQSFVPAISQIIKLNR